MAVRRRRRAGPDGETARAEGHREDGAGFHQRRTIATREGMPGEHVHGPARCGVIAVFRATGIRLSELAGIRYVPDDHSRTDLDLDGREIRIRGKGGKGRIVKIGHEAARAVDRYLRVRGRHAQAYRPQLWLGVNNRGPLTPAGSTRP